MPWMPGVIRKEVTRHRTPMARHRGVCKHVAVSEAASLFGYFNQPGNPTSHWYVRRDGTTEQYVDSSFRAPAQLEGNPTMLSVETQGGVHDVDHEPWTPEQVDALARIAAWANATHGIPLIQMTNSLPSSEGIGYHKLGVDPYRVTGGELWSQAYGKVCPGTGKIAQIPTIITRARQLAAGGDDFVATMTDEQLAQFLYDTTETRKNTSLTASRLDNLVNIQFPDLRADVEAMKDDLYKVQVRTGTNQAANIDSMEQSLNAVEESSAAVVDRLDKVVADLDAIRDHNTPVPDAD